MASRRERVWRAGVVLAAVIVAGGCCCGSGGERAHFAKAVEGVNVFVDPALGKQVKSVAVLPFTAPTELSGSSVADMIMTDILRSRCYTLVERSQISKVLGETELALAGVSSARAMEVGQMAGADGVIIGTVYEYEMTAYKGDKFPSVGINIRLIDSKTGNIVWSADYAERSRERGTSLSEHARTVVHAICSTLYQKIEKAR